MARSSLSGGDGKPAATPTRFTLLGLRLYPLQLAAATAVKPDGTVFNVPDGDYRILIRALRSGGNSDGPHRVSVVAQRRR